MVRILKQLERGVGAELFAERFQELQVSEIIARALEKQQRNLHVEEVLGAFARRLTRWVQRESEKQQASHSGQRRRGLRLRGHAATKGFPTGEECELRNETGYFQHRRSDRSLGQFRGVRPF